MQNSKWCFLVICLVAIIKFHTAVPVPDSKNQIKSLRDTSLELDDLDLASSDEAGVSVKETAPAKSNPTRGKRTVGFLRTLFPNLSQIIDRKIQQITRVLFRVIGRLVLRGGNGGGGGDDGDKEGRKISITLPTYPPSEEDEEEEEDETEAPAVDSETEASSDSEATTPADAFAAIPSLENADNAIAESRAITKIARKTRKARDLSSAEEKKDFQNSNDVDQVEGKSSEDDDKPAKQEEDGKSKRVLFRFGGSGGASGNLLFDLIRLVAGSGATQDKDDAKSSDLTTSDSVDQGTVVKEDGYSSGIPGPFTRLLILLNRSLSNVVQDIIIRLAQTSERLVTFKAKLITSVI